TVGGFDFRYQNGDFGHRLLPPGQDLGVTDRVGQRQKHRRHLDPGDLIIIGGLEGGIGLNRHGILLSSSWGRQSPGRRKRRAGPWRRLGPDATDHAAQATCNRRNSRHEADLEHGHALGFDQIGREPGQEKPGDGRQAELPQINAHHHAIGADGLGPLPAERGFHVADVR
nr:hypothetical protein [Tanacetum cinerariifolium]